MTDLCTHVREEADDILGVVQLIRCFLLQEGKPETEQSNTLMFSQCCKKKYLPSAGVKYFSCLPTDFKCLTQNGHIFGVILPFFSADVEYFGDAC